MPSNAATATARLSCAPMEDRIDCFLEFDGLLGWMNG